VNAQTYDQVKKASKTRKLLVAVGDGTCFHDGNRVSLFTRIHDREAEETYEETVAEVWPTCSDADKACGMRLVHCWNNFDALMTQCKELLKFAMANAAPDVLVLKAARTIGRAETVPEPDFEVAL